jgi:probable HAF family extracellular repeat protein
MKSRALTCVILVALFATLSAPVRLGAQDQQEDHRRARYTVIDLGTLGGNDAGGNSINNRAWVTGTSTEPGGQNAHAALWIKGAKIDLGTLGGINSAVAWPVKNDRGVIVGISETSVVDPLGERFSCPSFFLGVPRTQHSCQGFKWQNGVMTPLPTLGGNNSYATSINNRGQAAGWAENTVHDPTCVPPRQVLQFRAVIWHLRGEVEELPPFGADTTSAATAINDEGQVVGISGICDRAVGRFSATHAVLWQNGTVIDLGNFGGIAWNTATAINHRGQIAGFSDFPGDASGAGNFHAFLWTREQGIKDLNTLPGDAFSLAFGINDREQVVGQSLDANGFSRAFIYEHGKMADLNELVPPGSPFLVYANDINDRGEIAGQACVVVDGACVTTSAVLLVPRHDRDDDDSDSSASNHEGNGQRVRLPENLRRQLEQRWGIGVLDGVKQPQ